MGPRSERGGGRGLRNWPQRARILDSAKFGAMLARFGPMSATFGLTSTRLGRARQLWPGFDCGLYSTNTLMNSVALARHRAVVRRFRPHLARFLPPGFGRFRPMFWPETTKLWTLSTRFGPDSGKSGVISTKQVLRGRRLPNLGRPANADFGPESSDPHHGPAYCPVLRLEGALVMTLHVSGTSCVSGSPSLCVEVPTGQEAVAQEVVQLFHVVRAGAMWASRANRKDDGAKPPQRIPPQSVQVKLSSCGFRCMSRVAHVWVPMWQSLARAP